MFASAIFSAFLLRKYLSHKQALILPTLHLYSCAGKQRQNEVQQEPKEIMHLFAINFEIIKRPLISRQAMKARSRRQCRQHSLHLCLTWDRLCPLDCSDHLAAAQHVESGEDPPAGVGQGAVIARVEHLGLDDLEQGHQGGRQLGQGRGHDALVAGRLRSLACARHAALLQPLDLLLRLAGCQGWGRHR